jgi:lipoprotein-releasing system permease protein
MIPGLIAGNVIGLSLLLIQKYFKIITLPAENYYLSTAPVYIDFFQILVLNLFAVLISAIVLIVPSYFIAKVTPSQAMKIAEN